MNAVFRSVWLEVTVGASSAAKRIYKAKKVKLENPLAGRSSTVVTVNSISSVILLRLFRVHGLQVKTRHVKLVKNLPQQIFTKPNSSFLTLSLTHAITTTNTSNLTQISS